MIVLLLHALVTTALYYLGSRAEITRFLWSRYPYRLAKFLDCAACAGFWYGGGVALAAEALGFPLLPGVNPAWVAVIGAFSSLVWTPMLAFLHQESLIRLGSAVGEPESP